MHVISFVVFVLIALAAFCLGICVGASVWSAPSDPRKQLVVVENDDGSAKLEKGYVLQSSSSAGRSKKTHKMKTRSAVYVKTRASDSDFDNEEY